LPQSQQFFETKAIYKTQSLVFSFILAQSLLNSQRNFVFEVAINRQNKQKRKKKGKKEQKNSCPVGSCFFSLREGGKNEKSFVV